MKINKDYLWRIFKTFVQAFISAVAVELIAALKSGIDLTDKNAVKGLIIGLVSAGLCAAMNVKILKGGDENEV